MRRLVTAVLFALLPVGAALGQQAYPNQIITLVVPFAAGGPTDVLARLFAQSFAKTLGQQVIVENAAGAGGTIGSLRGAKSRPDGYTLLFNGISGMAPIAAYYKEPPYDAVRDFEVVARVADIPYLLVTRKNAPANNLKEFMLWVKANGSKLNFGMAGVGGVSMGLVVLNSALGVKMTGVGYRGLSLALQDMIAGNIDVMACDSSSALPQIKAGTVKVIATMSDRRSAVLPDVPTTAEGGLVNAEFTIWNGIWAPKGTPPAIIDRLHAAAVEAFGDEFVKQRMAILGAELPAGESSKPGPFKAFVQSEINRWVPLMKAAGVVPQ